MIWASIKGVYVTGQELAFLQPFQGLVSLGGLRRTGGRWATIHSGGLDVSSKACVLKVVLSMVRSGGLVEVGASGHAQCHGLAPVGP